MNDLMSQLLTIDLEAGWKIEEVEAEESGEQHFKRYLGEVLAALKLSSGADQSHAAISALECGAFKPFVALGQPMDRIPSAPTYGGTSLTAKRLETKDPFQVITLPQVGTHDPDLEGIGQRVLIHLVGHGELFGFLCLDRKSPHRFTDQVLGTLRESVPLLTKLVAEQNFSMRVRQLAGSFQPLADIQHLGPLYEEIVERTTRGFGADGAVVRIFYPEFDPPLIAEAKRGDVPPELLQDQSPGEGISGKALIAPHHSWVVVVDGNVRASHGMELTDTDLSRMRQAGINSFIVMRLETDVTSATDEKIVGTLSYFFRRPHQFSWRDVALFRSFCERVADTVALHRQSAKLLESYENLRRQSMMITQVEIATLVAHDLFHKSFNTCQALEQYIRKTSRALGSDEPRSHAHVEEDADRAMTSALAVQHTLQQLRSLQSYNLEDFEKRTQFDLADVFDDIETTLGGALARNNLSIRREFAGKFPIMGARSVLNQVFFNLVINSIDAARSRRTRRPMSIHVQSRLDHSSRQQQKLTVSFWDEGPGIDRSVFKEPEDIFLIGKTTKPHGTGTGLPVARILLTKYFRGSLDLEDAASARFRITIPLA